jgi:uncharacterized membrane protein YheB (UPF0754 family)
VQRAKEFSVIETFWYIVSSKYFLFISTVLLATFHGYGAAWLAVRMLFRPHNPVKLFGFTIWPQGMIPRHRLRLAETIGNAVGNELVSQETVVNALFETDFFKRKVESFINNYTNELLSTNYPSVLDLLPNGVREPALDAIFALQNRIGEYIVEMLKSEETVEAIQRFMDRRIDELLNQHVSETLGEETMQDLLRFLETRFKEIVNEPDFESKIRGFINARLDDLASSQMTISEVFSQGTIELLKERVSKQVPPIVHQVTEIATREDTRGQIGSLIKREVDDYYDSLSFFKKIFISRELIHKEVDDLVNETLPKRVEEYLNGADFSREVGSFFDRTIEKILALPVSEAIEQIVPDKWEIVKEQVATKILALARSPELSSTVSAYATDALKRLSSQTWRDLLETTGADSSLKLKKLLTKNLLTVLEREETARTVNAVISTQLEKLLVMPIGKLSDHLPQEQVLKTSAALTVRIVETARERLPAAIAEFDVGNIVRNKVANYPLPKLEDLVLSVAKQHLRTIELFGAAIGFILGVVQGIYVVLVSR